MIIELTHGGRMKLKKLLAALTLVGFAAQLSLAQTTGTKKPTDDPEALKKDAVAFLRETMVDVNNLRTLENRISFSAELAGLMWFHDEREARGLYVAAFANFKELLMKYDQQMNTFPQPGDDDEGYSPYRGGLFVDITDKARIGRRFAIAMQVRQQIAMSLAEHDPELAFAFYSDSLAVLTNPQFRKQAEMRDEYFEAQLMTEIAKTNAAKAAQFAKKSMEKELNYQHIELLKKIYAKDPEKGGELAAAMLSKVKTSLEPEQFWVVGMFLGAVGEALEASQKNGKKPMLSQSEVRELADTFAQAILNSDEESPMGLGYVDSIEKYSPSRAAQIRAKFTTRGEGSRASGGNSSRRYAMNAMANAANTVANAANAAANSNARAEKERQEREKLEKELQENVGKLADKQLPKEEREKIVAHARRIIVQTQGRDKKIVALSALAATVAKAGDKELSAEIMKEAQALVNPYPKNYQDLLLTWMLATGYAEVEPEKAFPLLEDTIFRVNDTLSAFIKVGEFIDVAGEMIDEGEVQVGAFGGQMVRGLTSELGMADAVLRKLAKADFKKTRDLTSRFDRSEVRILAKMMILRAVLGESREKPEQSADEAIKLLK